MQVTCQRCKKKRTINIKRETVAAYEHRRPYCQSCSQQLRWSTNNKQRRVVKKPANKKWWQIWK